MDLIDKNNGEYFLSNENNVKKYLGVVENSRENFFIEAYTRNIFSFQKKKTKLLYHSFYVFTNNTDEYHTVSFYGTKLDFYSMGVWVMDSDADILAFNAFLDGNNNWDVSKLNTQYEIDTEKTVEQILTMIDRHVGYYYRDHMPNSNRFNLYNCNTALMETLAVKDTD